MKMPQRRLVFGFVACLAFGAGAIDMPQVVSHRGESQDRPENTMAAFRLAFERGVDGVECDVYATTDGVPVIIHDGTTGRTALMRFASNAMNSTRSFVASDCAWTAATTLEMRPFAPLPFSSTTHRVVLFEARSAR